jgi:hypothetical protein
MRQVHFPGPESALRRADRSSNAMVAEWVESERGRGSIYQFTIPDQSAEQE